MKRNKKKKSKQNSVRNHEKYAVNEKQVLISKKILEPYLEKIIEGQRKGQYPVFFNFDGDGNLHMHIHNALLGQPIGKSWENAMLGFLWHLLSAKSLEMFDEKENYKAKVKRDFLPLLLDIQKKLSMHFFYFSFDENADIFTSICWFDYPDPWPENFDTCIIRQMLAKLIQISEYGESRAALHLNNL